VYSFTMTTVHPLVKILLIGTYIGVVSQGLSPIISLIFYILPGMIVPFAHQAAGICAVIIAYLLEETIRNSKYPRNIKIVAAVSTVLLAAVAYTLYLAWLFRRLGF
jgi:hypothetical protein